MDNPESLSNIVFTRTLLGVNACKANSKDLPRQLKRLLLVVDGHSPVSKFIPFLTNLMPLSEKFSELEHLGYIQKSHINSTLADRQDVSSSLRASIETSRNLVSDKEKAILTGVMQEIENFLPQSARLEPLPVMAILKKISTIELLKEALPAYFDLIEGYAIDTGSHALKLENLMSRN
jgi:hypothetical protein